MRDLLTPRYKIIADYPGNLVDIGFLIIASNPLAKFYDKYPHLFKKMYWWEEREESDMPMYLKHTLKEGITSYHKIESWDMKYLRAKINNDDHVCDLLCWNPKYTYQPATEEEYLNSLKNDPNN